LIGKLCAAPKGGGSARSAVQYILGYAVAAKGEGAEESFRELMAEAGSRPDFGAEIIWKPTTGGGVRPSAIFTRGVTSLETAAVEMEAIARANPRCKEPVKHFVFSHSAHQSKTITDEQVIRSAEAVLAGMGYGQHQAVYVVHRDTDQVHCHVALTTARTIRNYVTMAAEMRKAEIAFGLDHDHGAIVVDYAPTGEKFLRPRTYEEKQIWLRDNAELRLESRTRKVVGDYDEEFHSAETWARNVVTPAIGKALARYQEQGQPMQAADVHVVAAAYGTRVQSTADGRLAVTVMERVPEGEREAEAARIKREQPELLRRDEFGELADANVAKFRAKETIVLDVRDAAGHSTLPAERWLAASTFERKAERERVARAALLSDLPSIEAAEATFAAAVWRDPGMISREIVDLGQSTFTRDDIFGALGKRLTDEETIYDLYAHIEAHDKTLRVVGSDRAPHEVTGADAEQPLMSTAEHLALEDDVRRLMKKLANERDPYFDAKILERAISSTEADLSRELQTDFRFTEQQLAIIKSVEYRLSVANGDAGTGKTFAMRAIARYGELQGRDVSGYTVSEKAAKKLQDDAKIRTANTAKARSLEARDEKYIALPAEMKARHKADRKRKVATMTLLGVPRGEQALALRHLRDMHKTERFQFKKLAKQTIRKDSIVIIDETSMLDFRAAHLALKLADERNATTKLIGDAAQLDNIQAGSPHAMAMEVLGDRVSFLTEVRRQNPGGNGQGPLAWMAAAPNATAEDARKDGVTLEQKQRGVVSMMGDAIRDEDFPALAKQIHELDRRGVISLTDDRAEMIHYAVDRYRSAVREGKDTLMLAGDRFTCNDLNNVVLRELDGEGRKVVKNFETAEYGKRGFAVGDKIAFLQNNSKINARQSVDNGDVGVIKAIGRNRFNPARWDVTVAMEDGKHAGEHLTFSPNRYRSFNHAYALTIHKAQGQSVDSTIVVADKGMQAKLLHVAASRPKLELEIVTHRQAYADIEAFADKVADRIQHKQNAASFERIVAKTGGPDTVWAREMRKALDNAKDPLRKQHASEMEARHRTYAIAARAIHEKNRPSDGAAAHEKQQRRAAVKSEIGKLLKDERFAAETFVEWGARRRVEIVATVEKRNAVHSVHEKMSVSRAHARPMVAREPAVAKRKMR